MNQTVVCPNCRGHVHVVVPDVAEDAGRASWRVLFFIMLLVNLLAVLYVALFVYNVSHPFG